VSGGVLLLGYRLLDLAGMTDTLIADADGLAAVAGAAA